MPKCRLRRLTALLRKNAIGRPEAKMTDRRERMATVSPLPRPAAAERQLGSVDPHPVEWIRSSLHLGARRWSELQTDHTALNVGPTPRGRFLGRGVGRICALPTSTLRGLVLGALKFP